MIWCGWISYHIGIKGYLEKKEIEHKTVSCLLHQANKYLEKKKRKKYWMINYTTLYATLQITTTYDC